MWIDMSLIGAGFVMIPFVPIAALPISAILIVFGVARGFPMLAYSKPFFRLEESMVTSIELVEDMKHVDICWSLTEPRCERFAIEELGKNNDV